MMESHSPEHYRSTLTQCYPKLCSCIQQSPTDVATQLRPYEILAPEDWTFITNPHNTNDKKAMRIVDAVLIQVQHDSQVFHSFVSALGAAGFWTKGTILKLQSTHTGTSLLQPLQGPPLNSEIYCGNETVDVGREGG